MNLSAGTLYVDIRANLALLERDMGRLASTLKSTGRGLSNGAESMFMSMAAPLNASVGMAIKQAASFEQSFAAVKRTVGGTDQYLSGLKKSILDMSAQLPVAANDIAGVAAAAGQLGIAQTGIVQFTDTMVKLGTVTNMTAEEAATSLAKFFNIYNLAEDQYKVIGDAVAVLGVNAAATESEIVGMTARIAVGGTIAKMSAQNLLAFATTMASLGIEAEMGGTAFTKTMQDISAAVDLGGRKLQVFATVANMSSEEFKNLWKTDSTEAIKRFLKGFKEASDAGINQTFILKALGIEESRQQQVIGRLSQGYEMLGNNIAIANDKQGNAARMEEMLARNKETLISQLKLLWASVRIVGIEFGDKLIPVLVEYTTKIKNVITANKDWIVANAGLITEISATLLVVTGLGMWLGKLVTGFGYLINFVKSAAKTFGLIINGIGGAALAISGFLANIWNADAIIGLRIALIDIQAVLASSLESVGAFFGGLVGWLTSGAVLSALGGLTIGFTSVFGGIIAYLMLTSDRWDLIWGGIVEAITDFGGLAAEKLGALGEIIKQFGIDLKGWLDTSWLGQAAGYVYDQMVSLYTGWMPEVEAKITQFKTLLEDSPLNPIAWGKKLGEGASQIIKDLAKNFDWALRGFADATNNSNLRELADIRLGFQGQSSMEPPKLPWVRQKEEQTQSLEIFQKGTAALEEQVEKTVELTEWHKKLNEAITGKTKEEIKAEKAAVKARKQREADILSYSKMLNEIDRRDYKAELSVAIDNVDLAKFDEAIVGYTEELRQQWQDKIADIKDTISAADLAVGEKKFVESGLRKAYDDLAESQSKKEEELQKQKLENVKELTQSYRQMIDDAFSGKTIDFSDAFKDLSSGIAGAISSAISGGKASGKATNFQDLGNIVGEGISSYVASQREAAANGGQGQSLMSSVANAASSYAEGNYGNIIQMAIQSYIDMIQTGLSAKKVDKSHKDNRGTGAAIGGAIGTVFGPFGYYFGKWLGGAIGKMIKWGPQQAETKERHRFTNVMEEKLSTLNKRIGLINPDRTFTWMNSRDFNFKEGSVKQFNDPKWPQLIGNGVKEAQAAFLGLGYSLNEVEGMTENVGAQIALMFSQTVAGSVDNAKILVAELGYSFEDLSAAILKSAEGGKIRWAEYTQGIAGLNEVFKVGLTAVGDYAGAYDLLVNSGGRGIAAVMQFRNIAVEAMEKNITTLDGLKQALLAAGKAPEEVDAMFSAVAQSGVTSLNDWAALSNEQAGTIIGNMEGLSQSLQKQWVDMQATLDNLKSSLDAVSGETTARINVEVVGDLDQLQQIRDLKGGGTTSTTTETTTDTSGKVKKYAKGGVFSNPALFQTPTGSLGMLGEAGPEAILPLARVNGKLGVISHTTSANKGLSIFVDARYADAGVETKVYNAIQAMRGTIVNDVAYSLAVERNRRV